MDESQLIEGCKKQERRSQQAIYEKYAAVMYSICLRYSSSDEAAQDLLQDGFIKVFSKITTFQGKGSFEGWLKRIFINLALEYIRREKNKKIEIENLDNIAIDDFIENDEDEELLTEEILLSMIQELPSGYRSVFNLYAIEDYSHKEVSKLLGITEGTSRSQYTRARLLLQEKVKEYRNKNATK